jgi:hypothetical protein
MELQLLARHENERHVMIGPTPNRLGRFAYHSRQETDELLDRPAFGMSLEPRGLRCTGRCTAATATSYSV